MASSCVRVCVCALAAFAKDPAHGVASFGRSACRVATLTSDLDNSAWRVYPSAHAKCDIVGASHSPAVADRGVKQQRCLKERSSTTPPSATLYANLRHRADGWMLRSCVVWKYRPVVRLGAHRPLPPSPPARLALRSGSHRGGEGGGGGRFVAAPLPLVEAWAGKRVGGPPSPEGGWLVCFQAAPGALVVGA